MPQSEMLTTLFAQTSISFVLFLFSRKAGDHMPALPMLSWISFLLLFFQTLIVYPGACLDGISPAFNLMKKLQSSIQSRFYTF